MSQLSLILLALGFVLLNAFFVAAEFAMVKLRHSRAQILRKTQGLRGRVLYQVHLHLEAYLSACQLGITLASLGLGWVGEPAFAKALQPLFLFLHITSPAVIKLVSLSAAFTIISFLHIVVGELMPKTMAIRQSEKISLWTAVPLYMFYWTMYPFIWLLNASANFLLRIFRLDNIHHGEHTYSADELKFILKTSHSSDEIGKAPREMLLNMLAFNRLKAVDVMRPLHEMVSIDDALCLKEKLKVVQQYRYTRYPVYKSNLLNIIGILHAKDLFIGNYRHENILLRPIVKVKRSTKAARILEHFQSGMTHFALVYHEEKPVGFMTLDDLLHVLMGKMGDEFNLTHEDWIPLTENSFLLKGSAPVYVIEKILDIDLSHYPVDTVAGLILEGLGGMPQEGDEWKQSGFSLQVSKVKGPRITEVILSKQL